MISILLLLSQIFSISTSSFAADLNLVSDMTMTGQECYNTSETGAGRNTISCARLINVNLWKICTNVRVDPVDPFDFSKEKNEFKVFSDECKVLETSNGSCPPGFEPKPTPSKIPNRFTVCKKSSSGAEELSKRTIQKSTSP